MSGKTESTIQIREITPNNADDITDIIRDLHWFPHLNSEPRSETVKRVTHQITANCANDTHIGYVAVKEEHVIGYCSVHWIPYLFLQGDEGYVSEVFVAESHRGKGIGERLVDTIIHDAEEQGCVRLMLVTGKNRDSYQRGFYKKHGWTERERIANFVYEF